jgi:cell division protein FtsB
MSYHRPPSQQPDLQDFRLSRRFLFLILIVLCVLFVVSYAGRLTERTRLYQEIRAMEARIELEEARTLVLAANLDYVDSEDYVDRVAREELGMGREGDRVMIIVDAPTPIPADVASALLAEPASDRPIEAMSELVRYGDPPIWKQWLALFVHGAVE